MSGIKRSPADDWFSKCVREAHNHTCEMCGKVGRMETSHVHSRRHRTIRWDVLNVNCLCNGCHRKWHESPLDSFRWFAEKFGEGRVDILLEKKRSKVKISKQEEKGIAKHYKAEFDKLMERRDSGETGYLEFLSYQ